MNYDYLCQLRNNHPAWRLLTLDNAPLIAGFLHHVFIRPNKRAIRQRELVSALDDYLYDLRLSYGEKRYPRPAREYLDSWAHADYAFLRKYYPPQEDEAEYDLSAATEKALEWLNSLREKQFVGTESRLLTIFELLRNLVHETESDTNTRITELNKRKTEIEDEISRLHAGGSALLRPTTTQVKERFFQIEETARHLLSDFRQVEANFRQLDQKTRERIALADKPKAELLAEIFGEQDAISQSDQGRSFDAFWTFLMSLERREELQTLLTLALDLPEISSMTDKERDHAPERWLADYRFHLSEAGEKVQRTAAQLVEQLRRFLDSKMWQENKRIAELIHDIDKNALRVKHHPPKESAFASLPETKINITIPFTRTLFSPPRKIQMTDEVPLLGESEFSAEALFNQHYVDEGLLRKQVALMLSGKTQAALSQIVEKYPVTRGMAEIVTYINLANRDANATINENQRQKILWNDTEGKQHYADIPLVIFTR
ncbi:MAG: DUF3375 domain-containing protein [Gallionella sp.]